jgi:poly-beta-1,6-N-acetyl-D-glucosamine biosynthesis protein PgaD
MSDRQQEDWPPIISGAERPAWVLWRGFAITTFMWGLFLFIVEREMEIVWQALWTGTRQSAEHHNTVLDEFLVQLRPALWIILLMIAILGFATLRSRRRRNAALLRLPPPPVPDLELARDLGIDEQELHDIRRQKIVALDVDDEGRVSVRPDWKSFAGASTD